MIYNHGNERWRELVLYARGGNGRIMYKEGPRWISPGKKHSTSLLDSLGKVILAVGACVEGKSQASTCAYLIHGFYIE